MGGGRASSCQAADLGLSHLGQGGLRGRESSPVTIHASPLLSLDPRPLEPHVPAQIWEAAFLASNSSFITHEVQGEYLILS